MKVYELIDKWLWRCESTSVIEIWNRHILDYIFRGNRDEFIKHNRFIELSQLEVGCFQSYNTEDKNVICININTDIEFEVI